MANKSTESSKSIPPYVAFKTFENFLDTLRARVVPSRIERSVVPTMGGGIYSHLISTLRYLEFINENDQPTERFKAVVQSQGDERKKKFTEVARRSYPWLFEQFDLTNVTSGHLEEQFEAHTAATGSTLRKCVAFFLALCRAADIPISPLLKRRTRGVRGNGQRRRPPAGSPPASSGQEPHTDDQRSAWSKALLEKFPAFDPNWSEEVQAKWFAAFERLMGGN